MTQTQPIRNRPHATEPQEGALQGCIPFPHLNSIVVASTEFVGGICLILGLVTRVVSVQLAVIMLVATLTAEIKTVHTLGDFLYLPTVLLFVIFIWLVFSGPGKVSIDSFVARRLGFEDHKAYG